MSVAARLCFVDERETLSKVLHWEIEGSRSRKGCCWVPDGGSTRDCGVVFSCVLEV